MKRHLRLTLIACFVVVTVVAAVAGGLVVADRIGFSRTVCSVVAFDAPGSVGAIEIPRAILDEHPEIGRAMDRADPPGGGVENFDCGRYDKMRADVDALGAPPGPEGGLLLSRYGAPYSVSVSLGVA